MTNPTAHPLAWPMGIPRHHGARQVARFSSTKRVPAAAPGGISYRQSAELTLTQAVERVLTELGRFSGERIVISTNIEPRLDGLPRAGQRQPEDPGVAVYFYLRKKPYCLPCDRWTTVADNLAAVAAHLGAMRGMDRWGVGTVEQAFTGYLRLPSPDDVDWRAEFPNVATLEDVERIYRERARSLHPDTGNGHHEAMVRLNRARDAARKELRA